MRPVMVAALLPALLFGSVFLRAQNAAAPDTAPPCKAADLSFSIVPVFYPAKSEGEELLMLQLFNTRGPCILQGSPALDSSSSAHRKGNLFTHTYDAKLMPVVADDTPNPALGSVPLKNGDAAQMRIAWRSIKPAHSEHGQKVSCRKLDAIRLALAGDEPLTEIVSLDTHVCGALHESNFSPGWVQQTTTLRASWTPDAPPDSQVVWVPANGNVFGDHFNGVAMSLKAGGKSFLKGGELNLESHVKNWEAHRDPIVGEHPFRWLKMREANGRTVLCWLGEPPPKETGVGYPLPVGENVRLPNLNVRELGMFPAGAGPVTYTLTAEFWPTQPSIQGNITMTYAPTTVVSRTFTLNFTE